MKYRIFILILLIIIGYINLSCFCKVPIFGKELINNSDLIFEGYLSNIIYDEDTEDKLDLQLVFKPIEIYKGQKSKKITFKTETGSCGFYFTKKKKHYLNRQYLMYLSKKNGELTYFSCDDRMIEFKGVEMDEWSTYKDEKLILKKREQYLEEIESLKKITSSK